MRKGIAIFLSILMLVLLVSCSNSVSESRVKEKTYSHLETVGYTQNDIEDIEIKHSFINKVLGYNEWRIFVEFKKEPDIVFAFTYRDNQIIRQGIKSNITQLEKEEIYEYDRKFDNGELKNN